MRDARIQISKLNCTILHILSVIALISRTDTSPIFFRKFVFICVYSSIHLFLAVTLNFIMNLNHIGRGMQSLMKFCGNTVHTVNSGGWGNWILLPVKKIQQLKLNSHLFHCHSISQIIHSDFGLSHVTESYFI